MEQESREFLSDRIPAITKLLILTSVEILPQYGFTGFGLCFAEMTGIQVYYYSDNCFARFSSAFLKKLEGMSLTRAQRDQLLLCPVDTRWMGRRWELIQFSFNIQSGIISFLSKSMVGISMSYVMELS